MVGCQGPSPLAGARMCNVSAQYTHERRSMWHHYCFCDRLVVLAQMATDPSANPPEYFTREDVPELVKSVADAVIAQLRPPLAA